jgi:hypothetical protein
MIKRTLSALMLCCAGSAAYAVVLPGDGNGDGYVGIGDHTVWADHFGESGPEGDYNFDNIVDIADYTVFSDDFGLGVEPFRLAGPQLVWARTDMDNGLVAYDFSIEYDDGLEACWAVTAAFVGNVNQVFLPGSWSNGNRPPDSVIYIWPPIGGEIDYNDSWAFWDLGMDLPGMSLTGAGYFTGFRSQLSVYEMSIGSGPGVELGNNAKVAHIVLPLGESGQFSAIIARDGVEYLQSWTVFPEPASLSLLGVGAVALLRRKR